MNRDLKDNTKNQIGELIKKALQSELKAKTFYIDASSKAQTQAGKKFFMELAEFEQNHYERVKEIFDSWDRGVGMTCYVPPHSPLFIPGEIDGEFEPNKDEIVTIISLALEAEKQAQDRYLKIASLIMDSEGKKIFNTLAEEEHHHQKILEDQFYHLSNKGTIIWE
jgi:rubrerythrin